MILDLQKANMWKRISAYLFDIILLSIAAVGFTFLLSNLFGYDTYTEKLDAAYEKYEAEFNVDFDISSEEYALLSEDEIRVYDNAIKAMNADGEVTYVYTMVINLTLLMITFGILIAYLIFEFIIPLILKNGQTLGKKVFGIGVMRTDGIRLSPLFLFMRTILGKYTIETMVPVMILIMMSVNLIGIFGIIVLLALLIAQIILTVSSKTHSPIHDRLASTVTVDMASQMIFDTAEELMEYKNKLHAQQVEVQEYK